MMGVGPWRMLPAVLGVLAAVSFLLVSPVEAQGCGPYAACGPHASCYYDNYNRVYFCACDGYYTGNGYTCKYSTWRVVLYVLSAVIGFILIFFLCLSCLGYFRRQQQQPVGYPMQPMPNPNYSYPPPPAPNSTANPNMYSYPPQAGYAPQTGYPVNDPQQQQQMPQPSSKVPGPSGTV